MTTTLSVNPRLKRVMSVAAVAAMGTGITLGTVAPAALASDGEQACSDSGTPDEATVACVEPGSQTTEGEGLESTDVPDPATASASETAPGTTAPVSTASAEASTPADSPATGTAVPSTSATEGVTVTPSTETSAASCPGLDGDADYRSMFDYQYFAAGADGWVSLGTTRGWTGTVGVQYLNGSSTDPIEKMMVRAVVTLKADVDIPARGCEYDFSLASYEAQGPTFATSGQQVFVDHDTDTITGARTSITLEVAPAECFGQSDLYKGDDVYNGSRTPRGPRYAPITMDGNMIANWAGGTRCEEPSESPSPGTTPPSETPSPGTTPPSETPSPGTTPPSPGTTPPSTAPATTPQTAGAAPSRTSTPTVRGAANQRPALARTGAETWTVALVAGVLLAGGGALTALSQGSIRGRRH